METQVLNFKVEGAFITNFVRDRYRETGNLNMAVETLTTMLIDFPSDFAKQVILGEKKLSGINDVIMEDDDTRVYPYACLQPNEPEQVVCGWIAPDGAIFGHPTHNRMNDHCDIADDIVESFNLKDKYPHDYSNEDIVEKEGFVKFDGEKVLARFGTRPQMAQKDAIIKIMEAHQWTIYQIGYEETFTYNQILNMDLFMFRKHLLED